MASDKPHASKYGDYKRQAVSEMSRSSDKDMRAAALRLQFGKEPTESALKIARRRLADINSGSVEAAAMRQAIKNLDAMIYVERSSFVAEHKVTSAAKTQTSATFPAMGSRGINALHSRLADEMIAAGAKSQAANDIAFVMAWAATGRSVGDLIRNHASAFESFGIGIRALPNRRVSEWIDRAEYLAKGGK